MSEKKQVLIVIQLLRRGGIELVAIRQALALDKRRFDVTLYLQNPYDEANDAELADVLAQGGVRVISRPESVSGYVANYKHLCRFLTVHKFDVVHSHVTLFTGIVLAAAKKCRVPVRVAHAHATKWNHRETVPFKVYRKVMQQLIGRCATHLCACSSQAGAYLYGATAYQKRGIFVPNGIDTSLYAYNPGVRQRMRRAFGLADNEVLIGHIGTVYKIKNQVFLIDILNGLKKRGILSKLILVGEDIEGDVVRARADALGVTESVIFAGQRKDVPEILQAMDIMVFPSLHEALPVALIEAQAAQCPCVVSDTVTREVQLNQNVSFVSLQDPVDVWCDAVLALLDLDRGQVSTDKLCRVYDLSSVTEQLQKIYTNG